MSGFVNLTPTLKLPQIRKKCVGNFLELYGYVNYYCFKNFNERVCPSLKTPFIMYIPF